MGSGLHLLLLTAGPLETNKIQIARASVAEPPIFWAAPAPDGQGPGADSGSDLLGTAPAPGKKKGGSRRLRLHTLQIFILSSGSAKLAWAVNFLMATAGSGNL